MMKWTDRHFRWMYRLLTKRTILYTEMVVDDTILHRMGELEEYSEFVCWLWLWLWLWLWRGLGWREVRGASKAQD